MRYTKPWTCVICVKWVVMCMQYVQASLINCEHSTWLSKLLQPVNTTDECRINCAYVSKQEHAKQGARFNQQCILPPSTNVSRSAAAIEKAYDSCLLVTMRSECVLIIEYTYTAISSVIHTIMRCKSQHSAPENIGDICIKCNSHHRNIYIYRQTGKYICRIVPPHAAFAGIT